MEGTIGEIRLFAGNFAPKNWAFCANQIIAIAQNTALFSILGTTYGGNGSTTFALPDLRGRVAISPGQGPGLSNYSLGQMSGVENTTLLITNLPQHNHMISCNQTLPTSNTPAGNFPSVGQVTGTPPRTTPIDMVYAATADAVMNPAAVGVAGSSIPFSIMQPYLGMNYIICMYGIFPSRG